MEVNRGSVNLDLSFDAHFVFEMNLKTSTFTLVASVVVSHVVPTVFKAKGRNGGECQWA